MLVLGNRSLYFHFTDFWKVKSNEAIEITPFHLFQLMGIGQPHNSHYCVQHCMENDILMAIYKKPAFGRKAHLDLSLPGQLMSYTPLPTLSIAVTSWPIRTMDTNIVWLPNESLIEKVYHCTKHPGVCFYRSRHSHHVKDHMESCTTETNIVSVQQAYGNISTHMSRLVREKILPEELLDYKVAHMCAFDIETVNRDQESDLIPISIAVASTLDQPRYFERASSSPEDGLKMIYDFLNYLDHLQSLHLARLVKLIENYKHLEILNRCLSLPPEIEKAWKLITNDIINNELIEQSYQQERKRFSQMRRLEALMMLNIFGFNSGIVCFNIVQIMEIF